MRLGENRLTQIRKGFEQMVAQGYPLGPYGMELLAEMDALRVERDAARDRALDEAAAIADEWATVYQRQLGNGGPAAAIRALKVSTP